MNRLKRKLVAGLATVVIATALVVPLTAQDDGAPARLCENIGRSCQDRYDYVWWDCRDKGGSYFGCWWDASVAYDQCMAPYPDCPKVAY